MLSSVRVGVFALFGCVRGCRSVRGRRSSCLFWLFMALGSSTHLDEVEWGPSAKIHSAHLEPLTPMTHMLPSGMTPIPSKDTNTSKAAITFSNQRGQRPVRFRCSMATHVAPGAFGPICFAPAKSHRSYCSIRQDDEIFPVLLKTWKMGGLGP